MTSISSFPQPRASRGRATSLRALAISRRLRGALEAIARDAAEALEASAASAYEAAKRRLGRTELDSWWRVGFHDAPVDFVPWHLCSWENRFDDPRHEFRTLYCGLERLTCLREALADLRPDVNARAELAQLQLEHLGIAEDELFEPARRVTAKWRAEHVLAQLRLGRDGRELADIDAVRLRQSLEREHAAELRRHGMDHLDISEIRSKNRTVSQLIARDLFERGAAGVLFRSNLDEGQCVAVFEGRASIDPSGEPESLNQDLAELVQVCGEYGLILDPAS